MSREAHLTRCILQEALKRWRRGTVRDELAPSLTICLLGQEDGVERWYVSLVRYVTRSTKRVERRTEAATPEQALETIAVGFIPAGLDDNVDRRFEILERKVPIATAKPSKRRARSSFGGFENWCGGQCGGAVEGCDVCG